MLVFSPATRLYATIGIVIFESIPSPPVLMKSGEIREGFWRENENIFVTEWYDYYLRKDLFREIKSFLFYSNSIK